MKKAPKAIHVGAPPVATAQPTARKRSMGAKSPATGGRDGQSAPPRSHSKTGTLARLLRAPLRFVGGLFTRDLRLERDGKNLNLKLTSKADAKPATAAQNIPPGPDELELGRMRSELGKLLDVHPGARRVMRHLVYFERALKTQGLHALIEIPVEVLGTALEQLEALVSNWSNRDLATLRSKMSVVVVNRSRDPFYGTAGAKPSAFHTESRLHVGEASHSMFLELERQYQVVLPRETVQSIVVGAAATTAAASPTPAHPPSAVVTTA